MLSADCSEKVTTLDDVDYLWKGDLDGDDSGSENFDAECLAIFVDSDGNIGSAKEDGTPARSCAESTTVVPSHVSSPSELTATDGNIQAEAPKREKRKRSISALDAEDECSNPGNGVDRPSLSYVFVCQQFNHSGWSIFSEEVVCGAMRNLFQNQASGWENQLNSSRRASFIESMCKERKVYVKLLFFLLRFIDYLKTPEGRDAWATREANFQLMFGDTICRVLVNRGAYSYETFHHRNLRQSLFDSFACLSFLFRKKGMPLRRNLCFLLMVVSCIEGRGVYHGRTSNGLSMPHKCYRYMIEKLGGRNYGSEPADDLGCAEKELMATFE